ncbi:MAG: 16S rRNA (guanine(966)-N(2))-methyltransferase RsmD [Bacillota bacterium]
MRVIAGKYKGRKLNSPDDNNVRPTTDKAKEALFSILTNEIYGARVLDLFAGTGGLGIEALSRGASYCLFADSSRKSLDLIRSNVEHCKIEEPTRVAAGDYTKVLKNLARRIEDGLEEPFDIIFLDPPYDAGYTDEAFRLIAEGGILAAEGTIVAEHRKHEELPEILHGFTRTKERRYGVVKLSIYNNM